MSSFYPYGRLGLELVKMPLYALEMLVNHLPDQDPLVSGQTLEVIIMRISILSERDHDEVRCEVLKILEEKHDIELKKGSNSFVERMNRAWKINHCDYIGNTDSLPVNREFLHK